MVHAFPPLLELFLVLDVNSQVGSKEHICPGWYLLGKAAYHHAKPLYTFILSQRHPIGGAWGRLVFFLVEG